MTDSTTKSTKEKDLISLESKITEVAGVYPELTYPRLENGYFNLLKISLESINFYPPLYFSSVFGRVSQWLTPKKKYSEYTLLSPWKPLRSAEYLIDITVPAYSHEPSTLLQNILPPTVQELFWRPSAYYQQPDPFDNTTTFRDEHWFFVNGVATNEEMAKLNSSLLSKLFRRPISGIYNATSSVMLDLYQCAVEKQFVTDPDLKIKQSMTEPTFKATVAILAALKDTEKKKVVVICHSQGTIIVSNVLKAIQRSFCNIKMLKKDPSMHPELNMSPHDSVYMDILMDDELMNHCDDTRHNSMVALLKKLEVYTFANCADTMKYITYLTGKDGKKVGLPYIENFANQFDLVARLGVLSPLREDKESSMIQIDGPVFEKRGKDAWGHLLNQHYLFGMERFLEQESSNPYQIQSASDYRARQDQPRLYQYYNGERPEPYVNTECS